MQLLGSIIYITSTFYSFEGEFLRVHWTHSFFVALSYTWPGVFSRWDVP